MNIQEKEINGMKIARNILLLLLPFLGMVLLNEIIRPKIAEKAYEMHGIHAINSNIYFPEKCSWVCHNDTEYCKNHHVKAMSGLYEISDPLYFGAINTLASTGFYGAANIILFVILLPFLIWFLLIKSMDMGSKIRKHLKK